MKIAVVYPEPLPSDKARSVSIVNTVASLSKSASVTLFCEAGSRKELCESVYGVDLSFVNFVEIKKKLLFLRSNRIFNKNLISALSKSDVDIVYVRHLKTAQALIKHKQKKNSPFKIGYEAHEVFFETYAEENPQKTKKIEKLKKLESFVYSHCDALVCSNANVKKEINLLFSNVAANQTVVYNGTNFGTEFVKKDFSHLDEMYYIGSLFKWKGVDTLIKVFAKIPNKKLIIVGGGERLPSLRSMCEERGLDNIVFVGRMGSDEVKKLLLEKAKICVIPNSDSIQNRYSVPIKLFEYLSTSNVVVAPDMDTIKEIDEAGSFIEFFECGKEESMAQLFEILFSAAPAVLEARSKAGFEASLKFTWDARARNLAQFFASIIKS